MTHSTELYRSQNSLYEIDATTKRIRRLEGRNTPTEQFGMDGVWHPYGTLEQSPWGGLIVMWPNGRATMITPPDEELAA